MPILLITSAIFCGCVKMESHPYDGKLKGPFDLNAQNIKKIETATAGKNSIRFAFIGDTQREYDESVAFVNHMNQRTDVDFVVHGGDITDFGLTNEFEWMRDIFQKLKLPHVVTIGNHDCLANGEEIFEKMYGNPNFSFYAGNVKIVGLNTNALEADYSKPIPDFSFLEREIIDSIPNQKTVLFMHAEPYSEQFNNNVARVFQYSVKQFPNLQFCLNAHNHRFEQKDIFNDGVIYYGTPNIKKRQYLLFTINEEGSGYELVEF